ncbi:MAG: TetR family transcriptional regulator [Sandaracinaceae bacterium]|nr:TetR family transcriptional regulator [Sandaracinaceae bacterium]
MARPRNANAEETKDRILDAAIRRFGSEGLDGTSLRAIGGDAGVTFATVHHYFGCKSKLYQRCLDASYAELGGLRAALLETLTSTEGGVEDKVAALAKRAFRFARDHASHSRFLLRATLYEKAASERTRDSQRRYLDVTSEVLAPVLGRPAQALRVPLQGLMFLLTRMAVMGEDELAIIAGATDPQATDEQLGDYVASVALKTLL